MANFAKFLEVFASKDSFVAHRRRQARITVNLGPRHRWCKQDKILETKTKTAA